MTRTGQSIATPHAVLWDEWVGSIERQSIDVPNIEQMRTFVNLNFELDSGPDFFELLDDAELEGWEGGA